MEPRVGLATILVASLVAVAAVVIAFALAALGSALIGSDLADLAPCALALGLLSAAVLLARRTRAAVVTTTGVAYALALVVFFFVPRLRLSEIAPSVLAIAATCVAVPIALTIHRLVARERRARIGVELAIATVLCALALVASSPRAHVVATRALDPSRAQDTPGELPRASPSPLALVRSSSSDDGGSFDGGRLCFAADPRRPRGGDVCMFCWAPSAGQGCFFLAQATMDTPPLCNWGLVTDELYPGWDTDLIATWRVPPRGGLVLELDDGRVLHDVSDPSYPWRLVSNLWTRCAVRGVPWSWQLQAITGWLAGAMLYWTCRRKPASKRLELARCFAIVGILPVLLAAVAIGLGNA